MSASPALEEPGLRPAGHAWTPALTKSREENRRTFRNLGELKNQGKEQARLGPREVALSSLAGAATSC